jgi:hypothetical protein
MEKKHIVRLNDAQRKTLRAVVKKLPCSSQKARRAQILLKADADGPAWTDEQISQAQGCKTNTVENVRRRMVQNGFEVALYGKRPNRPMMLGDEQQAKVIELWLGPPPNGCAKWSLRLLKKKVIELSIVESICHETIRRTLRHACWEMSPDHQKTPTWFEKANRRRRS